ncbi:MAG: hypothetical protein Q9171_007452 [Xanthocarpia ochracea]
MSSLHYQPKNSPSRDTSTLDLENSFFRSWALRTRKSAYSSSSEVSPGTRTPSASPISPETLVPRPQRREVPNRSTDTYVHQLETDLHRRDNAVQQSALSHMAPGAAAHRGTRSKSRGSIDTLVSRVNSNEPSFTRRALSVIKGSASARRPTAIRNRQASKPVRSGLGWKRGLSGHLLEIRIAKKAESDNSPPEAEHYTPHVQHSPKLSSCTVARTGRVIGHSKSTISLRRSTEPSLPEGKPPKTSLMNRTKRILGIKSTVSLSEQPAGGRQRGTEETLHKTSSALRNLVELTSPSGSSTSNMSAASIGSRSKHRNLLRPRYHRQHTGHSSSSSVLRVMLGRTPVGTPNGDCMYTGSDSQQYFRVELTAPHAPTYLPSEARRIGTPPLPGDGNSKLRRFFFDYNTPRSASEAPIGPWPSGPMDVMTMLPRQDNMKPPQSPAGQRSPGARLQKDDPDVNWFRVKVGIGQAQEERGMFELNVPEHLPSSPLCPRHPKHKSGGKGVCVYHGRNRTGNDDVVEEEGLWH